MTDRWGCNGEPAEIQFPVLGHCTYNFTDTTVWIDSTSDGYISIPPPPHKDCADASFADPSWDVLDFRLRGNYRPIYGVPFAFIGHMDKNDTPYGQVQFTLVNRANNYSHSMACSAEGYGLQPNHFPNVSSTQWYDCGVSGARDYDRVPTSFRFEPLTGELEVRQEWKCEDKNIGKL